MQSILETAVKQELLHRREKLQAITTQYSTTTEIEGLLREVDAALARMEGGTFGLCEECNEPIETERLMTNPLQRFCLDHLTLRQQQAFEQDIELAARIQHGLLPPSHLSTEKWEVDYAYKPAGPVSGDYCDLISNDQNELFFILADVAGKGIAAAMLMSNLQAMFRSMVPIGLPLSELMTRANRLFCESTLSTHYATLVCGRIDQKGGAEFCNAGHLPAIVIKNRIATPLGSTNLPLGLFCDQQFSTDSVNLYPNDTILLFSDGVTEAANQAGEEYGTERLLSTAMASLGAQPSMIIENCLKSLTDFRGAVTLHDDLTLMALRYKG
jgi:sigma-B regulation protein RsbU (phosphoserine phosphatase)